ncbi:MAG: aldo/keto reductase [Bacteroidales bacterium]|nr:aldo/keto reductase [Bacteroidales bacterium]MBR1960818.1 aldo/keto reductase [Bacteroidales bacterium]
MKKNIDRRDFLKTAGSAALVMGGLGAVASCKGGDSSATAGTTGTEGMSGNGAAGDDNMTYRTNSVNGDKVSILGYGCMRWPMIKDADGKDIIDQETTDRLVDYAIGHGVNYFDTAPVYLQGQSEAATGRSLKRYPRESYYIATKLSNFSNSSKENSIEMYRNSLKNLQTDYIDYYLLHSLSGIEAFNTRFGDTGIMDFLQEERKAGRIRNLGFSFHGSTEGFDQLLALHEKYHWDFVQIQLNYVDWTHASGRNANAEYLQAELDKRGIQSIIMEPLLGGRLSKVPQHIADRLKERNPQGSVASWAFRFAGTHPGVLTVLSGMTYMEHLQDNVRTYSPLVPLNEDELAFLEETADLMQKYPTIPCNDCKYCMPCPYGIDIPAILLHYNKCVNEGEIAKSIQDENYKKARRAYLVSYDRAVPKLRQAARCIGCNQCTGHCPQRIDIPRQLHRIDKYIENLKKDTL